MKRHLALPSWFTGWLLAVVGGGVFAFGADVGASAATNAAFAQHLAQLNRKIPEGFTGVAQAPFVVIGDK